MIVGFLSYRPIVSILIRPFIQLCIHYAYACWAHTIISGRKSPPLLSRAVFEYANTPLTPTYVTLELQHSTSFFCRTLLYAYNCTQKLKSHVFPLTSHHLHLWSHVQMIKFSQCMWWITIPVTSHHNCDKQITKVQHPLFCLPHFGIRNTYIVFTK